MKKAITTTILILALALSSCTKTGGSKQNAGILIGAAAGGLIGSQFGSDGGRVAAGAAGALIGAVIGGSIGAQLDAQDRARLRSITAASARSGKSHSFRNNKTGVRATASVVKTTNENGRLCRTVKQNVVLANGSVSSDTVSACKGANGWSL